MGCYFPLPLRPTPEPPAGRPRRLPAAACRCPTGSAGEPTGARSCWPTSTAGLEPAIARGRVKSLRVMEQVRKTEDLASRAYDQSPVMSYGTYYAKRCWGTVPVEADGSAHFRAPALREIYFQVLDAEGRELQRMTSGVQVMPGERLSCVGCHEPRQTAPPATRRVPLAARRPPRALEPPAWGHDGIVDFPTVVQPVLDQLLRRAATAARDPAGGCDLSGDKTRYFNMAYDNLLGRSRSYRQHDMDTGEMLDGGAGQGQTAGPFLLAAADAHGGESAAVDRLPRQPAARTTSTAEHCEQRRSRWRTGSGSTCGSTPTCPTTAPTPTAGRTRPAGATCGPTRRPGQLSAWFARDFLGVYDRRCADVPRQPGGTTDWEGRFAWINLTRPAAEPGADGPSEPSAGGRGIATPVNGQPPPLLREHRRPRLPDHAPAPSRPAARLALETPEADMPASPAQGAVARWAETVSELNATGSAP